MWKNFFIGIGPDVSDDNDELTMLQYNEYVSTGKYKDRDKYEV